MEGGFFLQVLFGGLTAGSIYVMVGLGIALVYRATRVLNFAHGEFVVFGALLATSAVDGFQAPLIIAVLTGVAGAAALGFLLERSVLRPISAKPLFVQILVTLGASICLRGLAMVIWGKDPLRLPSFSGEEPIRLQAAAILPQTLWVICGAAVTVAALVVFLKHTKYGKALRASAEDSISATLVGIDSKRIASLSYLVGAGVGGLAGVLMCPITTMDFHMGLLLAMKGLTAAIIGGLDRIVGVVIGGILLGVMEAFGSVFVSSTLKDALAFAVLICILMFRPQGLLGHQSAK